MLDMRPMSSWTQDSVPVVTVRGAWRGEAPPEIARVYVTVSARGADRSSVLTQTAGRVDELRSTLDGYGEAVERVDAHPLRVSVRLKEGRWRDDRVSEKVTGYVAESTLTVLVVDFSVLGDLLLRLADREMVAVRGPQWSLRPDSPALRGGRAAALRDARANAEEYAAAVGSRLTGLVEISDAEPDYDGGPYPASLTVGSAEKEGSVADDVTLSIEPVLQTVSATVQARFIVAPPDFA
jgi:uncharacterized protein YggE